MYTDERGLKVSISADKNRCAIIVNYDIVIYSSPTHPVEQQKLEMLKQTIKNAIESRWNGLKKGCCIVEFKVDVSVAVDKPCWVCRWFSDSNYIEITNEDKFRSYVSGGKGGKWWADANPWVFAHEAGHLAGLPDDYKDVKYKDPNTGEEITQSRANEGHEGHMMATSGGKVVQHEVEDIVKNVACPCDNQ